MVPTYKNVAFKSQFQQFTLCATLQIFKVFDKKKVSRHVT